MSRILTILAAAALTTGLVAQTTSPAEAFSAFKGRYGAMCPSKLMNPCLEDARNGVINSDPALFTDSTVELEAAAPGDTQMIRSGFARDVKYECGPAGWRVAKADKPFKRKNGDTVPAGTPLDDGSNLCEVELDCTGKIRLGRKGDNYYKGHCKFIRQKLKFWLGPHDEVDRFRVGQVGFDDWVEIKLNDNLIYRGAYNKGGDIKPAPGRNITFGDTGRKMDCEQSTSWVKGVNRDAKHYAREGLNIYSMLLVVSGGGELWADVKGDFTLRNPDSDISNVCPSFTTQKTISMVDTFDPDELPPEEEDDDEDEGKGKGKGKKKD